MDILFQSQQKDLLQFLLSIKPELKKWILVDVRLTEQLPDFTVTDAAGMLASLYKARNGKLFICNAKELLMVIKTDAVQTPKMIIDDVKEKLPPGSCETHSIDTTPEGMAKLEIIITYRKLVPNASYAEMRRRRAENVVLVADDDRLLRSIVRKLFGENAKVFEASDGNMVMETYLEHNPDILLLDIHLPGLDGKELLRMITTVDPESYILMMSADSSLENVKHALQHGAKSFLAKPLQKEKLFELVKKCSSFTKNNL